MRIKLSQLLLLVVLSFILNVDLLAQQTRIDSLKQVLSSQSGIERWQTLLDLTTEFISTDVDKSFRYANEGLQLARIYNDSLKIVTIGRHYGISLLTMGKLDSAEVVLTEMLRIAKGKGYQKQVKYLLNNLGVMYTYQSLYDKALGFHLKSLYMREKDKDKHEIGISLNNVGLVYYKLGNYERAIEHYKRSLFLKKQINDDYDLERLLVNLSLCYSQRQNYKEASKYINEAFSICNNSCSSDILVEISFGLGMINFGLKSFDKSESYFLKSYQIATSIGDIRFQVDSKISLARIYLSQRQYTKAKKVLSEAEKLSSREGFNELLIAINSEFSNLYNQTQDFKNAAYYQSKYIYLKDSIYSEKLIQNLMAAQAEFEQKENNAKIESQNKILVLKEQVISRQNVLNWVAGMAVFLLLALIAALYKNNRQKRKVNQLLEQKVLERTCELSESYTAIQKAYSEQNHFISKTANDIKSPLSTVKGLCSLALKDHPNMVVQQYVIQINEAADQLSSMVIDLAINNEKRQAIK